MKNKIILLLTASLFAVFVSNSQVIEVVGTGVNLSSVSTLTFTDLATIDHVVVEAVYKSGTPATDQVHFYDGDESYFSVPIPVEYDLNATPYAAYAYYFTETFNTIGAEGITLDQLTNFGSMHSFVAYVYRTIPDPEYTSYIDYNHVFMFKNGIANAYDYVIPIGTTSQPKDVHVNAVISEMRANDGRVCVIDVTAGTQTVQQIFSDPNLGNALNITPFTITDVPGEVSEVTISIYSPPYSASPTGDSFISGAVVVNVEEDDIPPPEEYCTLTQGFYGNYGGQFNGQSTYDLLYSLLSTDLVIGGVGNTLTITQSDVDCLIGRLPGGGPSKVLDGAATCSNPVGIKVHKKHGRFQNTLLAQTITLGLNLRLDGYLGDVMLSDLPFSISNPIMNYLGTGADIDDLYDLANEALADEEIGNISLGSITGALGAINDYFDECNTLEGSDKGMYGEKKSVDAFDDFSEKMTIYPNPVDGAGSVEFSVVNDGLTIIELYDLQGKKISEIFNSSTASGEIYRASFDVSGVNPGIYLLILRNGDQMIRQKLNVN